MCVYANTCIQTHARTHICIRIYVRIYISIIRKYTDIMHVRLIHNRKYYNLCIFHKGGAILFLVCSDEIWAVPTNSRDFNGVLTET